MREIIGWWWVEIISTQNIWCCRQNFHPESRRNTKFLYLIFGNMPRLHIWPWNKLAILIVIAGYNHGRRASGRKLPRHDSTFSTSWWMLGGIWRALCTHALDGVQCHRPHSRQVTGARCTGGRGSPVMSWILLKANNAQQASGVGDKRFFRFKRNVQHLWTAIIRHHVNDITHQQVMLFDQWSKFANIF